MTSIEYRCKSGHLCDAMLSFRYKDVDMKVTISSRELEILRKSADGLTIQQIANDLNMSQQLISKSQKEILQRTGAGDPVNALMVLARKGFVLQPE